MNSLCFYFLFYLFLSGSIIFTILGVFAGSGNPALLIENSLRDKNNQIIKEEGLRKRITIQYFIAAFLDLCFSLLFLKFIYSQNNSSEKPEIIKEEKKHYIDNIKNESIENHDEKLLDLNINSHSINNEEINTDSNKGMSEKEE